MSWEEAVSALRAWYSSGDQTAARVVFGFLEIEFRKMVPAAVRRRWNSQEVDDAIASYLMKLIEKRLPVDDVRELGGYLNTAFRHHCVDIQRARTRRKEVPFDAGVQEGLEQARTGAVIPTAPPFDESSGRLRLALQRLKREDRVALKLKVAPEWLDEEELGWLVSQSGIPRAEIWERIRNTTEVYPLTRLFDPGDDDPADLEARRHRMERFRKRCARAQETLRKLLSGEPDA